MLQSTETKFYSEASALVKSKDGGVQKTQDEVFRLGGLLGLPRLVLTPSTDGSWWLSFVSKLFS